MSKIDPYKEKRLVKDFAKTVKKKMATECTQAELGEKFGGISQSGMGYLDFSNDEILKVMGR